MNSNHLLQGLALALLINSGISAVETETKQPLLASDVDLEKGLGPITNPTLFNRVSTKISENKKTVTAVGSATAALATNIAFGSANAPAATIFLGTFGTSVKGILPKSKDNQAVKIGAAAATLGAAVAADYGLGMAGFNTHWALSNLALVGGMSTIKRVQKGHFKEKDQDKQDKKDKKEKKQTPENMV